MTFTLVSVLTYLVIFLAKMAEVTMATLRNVLINRGIKLIGALIGFFEILIWVIVVSNVLSSLTDDPFKVVIYCLAFACGNYFGVALEGKIAIGIACLQVMVPEGSKEELSTLMYAHGFGVTFIQAEGAERTIDILVMYLKRKKVPEAIALIRDNCPDALITVNDVRHLRNGFIKK